MFYNKIFDIRFINEQRSIPNKVGNANATKVHFTDFVSDLTVRQVVEQGQWKSINIMVFSAVTKVHPFDIRICFTANKFPVSESIPLEEYIIKMSGNTISFAGKPNINAVSIIPSSPMILPKGSKKSAMCSKIDKPFIVVFEATQIINPAGAATVMALPKTNSVLSKIDRMIIFEICGLL